jgi:hypothetical protein
MIEHIVLFRWAKEASQGGIDNALADRMADGVERLTVRLPMSVREFVSLHADEFGGFGSLKVATLQPAERETSTDRFEVHGP